MSNWDPSRNAFMSFINGSCGACGVRNVWPYFCPYFWLCVPLPFTLVSGRSLFWPHVHDLQSKAGAAKKTKQKRQQFHLSRVTCLHIFRLFCLACFTFSNIAQPNLNMHNCPKYEKKTEFKWRREWVRGKSERQRGKMLFRRSCTYNVEQSTRHYAKVKHCIANPTFM